jgi:lipopolysaccharide export system protein LptA
VDALLAPAGPGQSQLKDAEATGDPHLTMVNNGSLASTRGEGTTELSADDLRAHLILARDAKQPPQLDTIAGRGHTVLHQMNAKGMEQISTGDALDATFRPNAMPNGGRTRPMTAGGGKAGQPGSSVGQQAADVLMSAVQQGHFTMMRRIPAKTGSKAGTKEDVQHAVAQRAAYDGDLNRMTLTGGVQLMDAGSVLWANQVMLDNKTGDSEAVGAVKVNYVQDNSTQRGAGRPDGTTEPTHILADRAERDHETDVATFHGKPVRMWQGASQIQAPVIELARMQNWLIARGEASTGGPQVHTVLTSTGASGSAAGTAGAGKPGSAAPGCANATAKAGAGAPAQTANVVRIASGGLMFSGISNQADFSGGFRADSADGTIRANAGTAYLNRDEATQSPTHDSETVVNGAPAPAVPSLTGLHLERIVATGQVDIQQPGLRATGERLLYTASDEVFLLTGDPQATDSNGTTTGAALRFHSSCADGGGVSVEALSAIPGEPAQRVQTKTRVNNDEKKEKGKR